MMVITGQLLIVLSTMIIVTCGGIAFCFLGSSTWEIEMKQLKQIVGGFCVLLVVGCAELGTPEQWGDLGNTMQQAGAQLQPKPAVTCLTYPGGVMRCQ